MPKQTALDIALSLAGERRSQAEQALAAAQTRARQAAEKSALLGRYRDDYLARMRTTSPTGIGMLMNSRAFVARLDLAVQAQQQEAARLEAAAAQAQQNWAEASRHEKSIEILMTRRQAAATLRASRAEQKLADEFAARAVRRAQAA